MVVEVKDAAGQAFSQAGALGLGWEMGRKTCPACSRKFAPHCAATGEPAKKRHGRLAERGLRLDACAEPLQ
jgi:hypothetical protein